MLPFPGAAPRVRRASPRRRGPWPVRAAAAVVVLLVGAAGLYLAARETSVFAVETIEVVGADPPLAARLQRVLRPLLGSSLVEFDRAEAQRLVFQVSQVADASFDRDFPHTLRVAVRVERPVAIVRQARDAWLVSARGRVLGRLDSRPYPDYPRIWVSRAVDLSVNTTLGADAATAVQVAAAVATKPLPQPVRSVTTGPDGLTLLLSSGTEVRLGGPGDLRLKLAVARRIVPLAPGTRYVDVSVPARVVASQKPQVEG